MLTFRSKNTLLNLVKRNTVYLLFCLAVLLIGRPAESAGSPFGTTFFSVHSDNPPDSLRPGGTTLPYPFGEETVRPGSGTESSIYLNNPSNLKTETEFDPVTRQYYQTYKIGQTTYRVPSTLSFEEYQDQDMKSIINKYWKERSEAATMSTAGASCPKS